MGTWRLSGNRFTTSLQFGGNSPLEVNYLIDGLSSQTASVTVDGEQGSWVRCTTSLSGAANPVTPPVTTPARSESSELAAQIQQAAAQVQSRLPLENGPLTILAVSADRTTLNMEATISADVAEAQWSQLEARMRGGICSGPSANLIRSGATVFVSMTDSAGERRSVTISRC
jgi:hypothetical protein